MKFQYFLFVFTFVFLFNTNTFTQPWLYNASKLKSTSSTISFQQQQELFNSYWKNKEIPRGCGYKQFRRWESFMAPRIQNSETVSGVFLWEAIQTKSSSNYSDTIDWQYIGPESTPKIINTDHNSGNGRLNCIAFHPTDTNTMYVGAPSGGLWITEDYGENWRTTTDQLNAIGISDIVLHANLHSTSIYIATGDGDAGDTYAIGIMKSVDNGENWQPTALSLSTTNGIYFRRLIMQPSDTNIMLASSSNGIYKTTDNWNSYSLVIEGDFKDLEFNPENPDIVYATSYDAGGNAQIYRSTDNGDSFEITNTGLNISGVVNRIELAVTKANSNIVYALASSAENSGFYAFYRSGDSGESWSLLYDNTRINLLGWSPTGSDNGGQGHYDLSLTTSPTNSDLIIAGGINNWKSVNGGTLWNLSSWLYPTQSYEYVHPDQHMLVYSPYTNRLYAANDGGIYRSYDNGESWSDISNNLQILQTYKLNSSKTDKNKIICGNQDNGTFFLNNSEWKMILGGDGMSCFIDPVNEGIVYGETYNGDLYKSEESGDNFYLINPDENIKGAWITPFLMHPRKSSTLYAAYKDVYKSVNGGLTWLKLSENLSVNNLNTLAIAPSNGNYIYTTSFDKIYRTTDEGVIWNELSTSFSSISITSICISPNDPNKIWVSLSGFNELDKIYYSRNGGTSWSNYSTGLPNVPINKVIIRPNSNSELFAATDIGIYYRNADSTKWVYYSKQLPNVIVSDIEIIDEQDIIRAATYGRGIWEAKLPAKIPSKANFEADIVTGCIDAPIQLVYKDSLQFDSLVWDYADAKLLSSNLNKDSITISFSNTGLKTIQLSLYKNDTSISEIKYEYLDIRDTLDISILPQAYYACDSFNLNIELPSGYEYNWAPDINIDTTKGNKVVITPQEDINYTVSAKHGSCETILEIPIILIPNNVCDALYLPKGQAFYFSNYCATTEENEPIPPIGSDGLNSCESQNGWCEDYATIENTLWFKFIVPDNGNIRIRVDGFDSQIALYKSNSCTDILNGAYEFIAANDDMNTLQLNSEIEYYNELTPGDTLYLQIDGSRGGKTGEFSVLLDDKPSGVIYRENKSNELSFSIYPNPSKQITNLKIQSPTENKLQVEIISITGRILYNKQINTLGEEFDLKINTSNLHGFYTVRVTSKTLTNIKKLIVL